MLTAGDLAGELAFLDSRPRYAALVALGPTKLFSLQRTSLALHFAGDWSRA